MKNHILFFAISLILLSCYKDNKEDLYPPKVSSQNQQQSGVSCDTSGVTYSGTIQPLIMNSCSTTGCHTGNFPASGVNLDNYTDLKTYVNNGQLIGTIKYQSGYSPMPKNAAKLADCEIAKLDVWINSGALNN